MCPSYREKIYLYKYIFVDILVLIKFTFYFSSLCIFKYRRPEQKCYVGKKNKKNDV